ncbi:MAG: DNA-binding response regulator [Bacteroidota bacterium]
MTITCIIVDDEPLARQKIASYVEQIDYLQLDGTFSDGLSALYHLRKHPTDLIFLDVQMDEFSGIQLLESLKEPPEVILTTAYDSYALKGFELSVADYLLKPISLARFLTAVEKVYAHLSRKRQSEPPTTGPKDFILVRSEYRLQRICLKDILYIEGMKDYSRIYTPSQKVMTLQNLKRIEEALPQPSFLRIHKSFIISLDKIQTIGKNDVTIAEQTIPIGGMYKARFLEFIEQQQLLG